MPTRIVGALKFPVVPSIFSTMSFVALPPEKSSSFFPLAMKILLASRISLRASDSPSLALAETSSLTLISRSSRNLEALELAVQPAR